MINLIYSDEWLLETIGYSKVFQTISTLEYSEFVY